MAVVSKIKKNDILNSEMKKRFWGLLNENENDCNEELKKIADKTLVEIPERLLDYVNKTSMFELEGYSGHSNSGFRVNLHLKLRLNDTYPQKRTEYHGKELEPTKKLTSLFNKRTKLLDKRETERKQLNAVLNAFSTDKRLLASVPELKEYFKDSFVCTALIPVEDIKAVRKLLKKTNVSTAQ